MNLWQQNYDPAGNIWLSSLIASLPILFFFFALIKLKLKGYSPRPGPCSLRWPSLAVL
jgi:L-lactate permease